MVSIPTKAQLYRVLFLVKKIHGAKKDRKINNNNKNKIKIDTAHMLSMQRKILCIRLHKQD